jgi:hypothetical protein
VSEIEAEEEKRHAMKNVEGVPTKREGQKQTNEGMEKRSREHNAKRKYISTGVRTRRKHDIRGGPERSSGRGMASDRSTHNGRTTQQENEQLKNKNKMAK